MTHPVMGFFCSIINLVSFYAIIQVQIVGRPGTLACPSEREVLLMARFYDSVNDSDLMRVEGLLKNGGIAYSLRVLGGGTTSMKEIEIAEEDLAAAESILYGKCLIQ
jgi:hypothetical protein